MCIRDRMGPVELASCAFGQSSKISYLEMASALSSFWLVPLLPPTR